jgi:hypothetical protein
MGKSSFSTTHLPAFPPAATPVSTLFLALFDFSHTLSRDTERPRKVC